MVHHIRSFYHRLHRFFLFRKEAIKEADETVLLPISLRISVFERMLKPLLDGNQPERQVCYILVI